MIHVCHVCCGKQNCNLSCWCLCPQPRPPRTGLTNEWAASMWPIIGQIYILQINLIMDIGMHEVVGNPMAAKNRVIDLLSEWQKFIEGNQQKALEGARAGLASRLSWRQTSEKACSHAALAKCKNYKYTQEGSCKDDLEDACKKMNCVSMHTSWQCRRRRRETTAAWGCNPSGKQVCQSSHMTEYFNTYVEGGMKELKDSVTKLKQDFSDSTHRRRRSRRRRSRRRTTTTTPCRGPRMGC